MAHTALSDMTSGPLVCLFSSHPVPGPPPPATLTAYGFPLTLSVPFLTRALCFIYSPFPLLFSLNEQPSPLLRKLLWSPSNPQLPPPLSSSYVWFPLRSESSLVFAHHDDLWTLTALLFRSNYSVLNTCKLFFLMYCSCGWFLVLSSTIKFQTPEGKVNACLVFVSYYRRRKIYLSSYRAIYGT